MYRKSLLSTLAALFTLGALASTALAQSSGFKEGELFVYANSLQAPGYNGDGIMRTNPLTGESSLFAKIEFITDQVGSMVFDPYRQRLVFSASLPGVDPSPVTYLWYSDGNGNLQNITKNTPFHGYSFLNMAPAKDGRIYCTITNDSSKPIRYLDAANQVHTLLAADGVTPFQIDGTDYYLNQGMIYDHATNALFVASTQPAPGFPQGDVNVRKLPLSADGTRVVGPVGNATFSVSPLPAGATSNETPRGWSYGPNGKLILIILNIDDEVLPRMLEVDPVTSAISVWGSNGQDNSPTASGWTTTTGGAYVPTLNQVVVMDYFNTKLRGYSKGSGGGAGNVIPTAPIHPGGYYVNITAIPDDNCTGFGAEYGAGLAGTGGFVPRLATSGCPAVNKTFTITIDKTIGGGQGLFLLGFNQGALPLLGGTLLVNPIATSFAIGVGGTPGVAGVGSVSIPVLFTDPALAGFTFYLQAGFNDAGAVNGASLTNGLQITIG